MTTTYSTNEHPSLRRAAVGVSRMSTGGTGPNQALQAYSAGARSSQVAPHNGGSWVRPLLCTRFSRTCSVALFAALGVGACKGRGSDKSHATIDEKQAGAVISRFQQTLQGKLTDALKAGGPAKAIDVCAVEAPKIAAQVGTAELRVRRIGTRTRSPANTGSTKDNEVLALLSAEHPNHATPGAFYQAILVKPICLSCHGEALAPEVKQALTERYPQDKAVGYQVGDLRGAFVVERVSDQ